MAGNQSHGLVAASKTRGWDPTKIAGFDGAEGDLAPWDHDPANITTTGSYAGNANPGTPTNPSDADPTAVAREGVSFNTPDVSRETANRRTRDAASKSGASGSSGGGGDAANGAPGAGSGGF